MITDILDVDPDVEKKVLGNNAQIRVLGATEVSQLDGEIEDADMILAWQSLHWNRETLGKLRNAKGFVRVGAGFDNVDIGAARDLGLKVSNVPDYGTHDVADHSIALLLSIARGISGSNREARGGEENWRWGQVPTFRITGKTLGIIGLGRIGAAVAMRAKALGMKVAFYDPYIPSGWEKSLGLLRFHDLYELAADSNVISLHTPLTKETERMINKKFFAALTSEIILINTGRGAVVDWAAFSEAFDSGKIAGAGLDVLPVEPPDFNDLLLSAWKNGDESVRDRLVITPHAGYFSKEAFTELRHKAAEEALRMLTGQRLLNVLN